jgi:ribosomal protein S18 acetylase RimI-like enzyme
MLLRKKDDTLVTYVQASKGEASTVKKHLPFMWADVNYMERMLREEDSIVILAKDENAIVGVVGGWLEGTPSGYDVEDRCLKQHNAYHEAHLDWIAVKEEHRETGVGTTLVGKVCNWARERGKKKIWTEASENTIIFYRKLGFQEVCRFFDEKKEENVTMIKRL